VYFVFSVVKLSISLYAYTHVAEEVDFSLGSYPNVRRWLARIANYPQHVAMVDIAS